MFVLWVLWKPLQSLVFFLAAYRTTLLSYCERAVTSKRAASAKDISQNLLTEAQAYENSSDFQAFWWAIYV